MANAYQRAVEHFETARMTRNDDRNPQEDLACGLIELTRALQAQLEAMQKKLNDMESEIISLR